MSTTADEVAEGEVDDVGASRPLRRDAARNRQLLLDAAREVFAERGLEATLDDVARRAGLGVGTAYRHFANKYDLAKAVLTQAIDEVIENCERAPAIDDPWDALVSVVEGFAHAQASDRGLREVLMGVHDDEIVNRVHDRVAGPIAEVLDRARAVGLVREDVQPSDIGMISMMLCAVADLTAAETPDLWRRYLPMLLAGLSADVQPTQPAMSDEVMHRAMTRHKQAMFDAAVDRDEKVVEARSAG